jgi:hypothetical protein
MTDLRKGEQKGSGATGGVGEPGGEDREQNRGAEFGTSERATRGTNRDADPSGESKNQGHGHPDANRNESGA